MEPDGNRKLRAHYLSDSDFDHSHNSKILGSGAYGLVQTMNYQGSICAAKQIHSNLIEHVSQNERKLVVENFLQECERCNITHPNIVGFYGVYCPLDHSCKTNDISTHIPLMIMELMEQSLNSFIENSSTEVTSDVKQSILFDVATGLSYLHQLSMIHRDLTPNNILLKRDRSKRGTSWVAKIGDLGVTKVIKANSNRRHS